MGATDGARAASRTPAASSGRAGREAPVLRSGIAALTLALVASATAPAHADRASGTWTGAVEARGNYYWEESTRVLAPAVNAQLEAPSGVTVNGHYLVDSITSASIAAGANEDVAFTEIRHDVGLGAGYEFDLGDEQLQINLNTRHSYEPDYWSTGAGVTAALSLNQRTTTLRARVFYIHDDVGRKLRGSGRVARDGTPIGNRQEVGTLDAVATTLLWDQVLSPVLTAQVSYDLNYMTGFLANAYRQVTTAEGTPQRERHPGTRWRHAVTGRLAWYIRPTGTALHWMYRAYIDSWSIAALTPEVRLYQEIGALTQLRLRYRYYKQTPAFFYEADNSNYGVDDPYVTADPKMSAFQTHLAGIQMMLLMDFLAHTSLHFLREATFDLSFDYRWNTNSFGNGVISQAGLRVPF